MQAEAQGKADLAREAQGLTDDLMQPRKAVYWADLAVTAALVYGGLAAAVQGAGVVQALGAVVAILALYRGVSFIHELTHLRSWDVPGFKLGWNIAIGTPFLVPSLLYEGVHNLHHTRQLYGTAKDPEYLPLPRSGALGVAAFLGIALLAPVGSFLRYAIGAPLALAAPRLRREVYGRASALTINPAFKREDLHRFETPAWRAQEIAGWLWSWALAAMVAAGGLPARFVLTGAAILSVTTFVNQTRTLVAHAWTSDGAPMSVADQFRDSINVPPPGWLPLLWAPVGLRYHALHHLLPRLPYHNLAEAHRRLVAALPAQSDYHEVQHRSLAAALRRVFGRPAVSGQGQDARRAA